MQNVQCFAPVWCHPPHQEAVSASSFAHGLHIEGIGQQAHTISNRQPELPNVAPLVILGEEAQAIFSDGMASSPPHRSRAGAIGERLRGQLRNLTLATVAGDGRGGAVRGS